MMKFYLLIVITVLSVHAQHTTDDCGTKYGCWSHPANCKNEKCTFIYKWINNEANTEFQLSGNLKKSPTASWMAIGFSKDQMMTDDCVVLCKSTTKIEHYYNRGKSTPEVLLSTDPSVGLTNKQSSATNSILSCNFTRQKFIENVANYFDLNKKFHILAAYGDYNEAGNSIEYHDEKVASVNSIDFTSISDNSGSADLSSPKIKAHGCIMVIAWLLLASTGILFARYYKHIFPNTKPFGIQIWFHIHRPFMIATEVLSIIALLIILSDLGWKWVSSQLKVAFAHSILGILTICFAFIQIIMGALRPDKTAPRRFIFDYAHRTLGILTLLASITTLFLGVSIEKVGLGSVGINILIAWLVMTFTLLLTIEIAQCVDEKNQKSLTSDSYELRANGNAPQQTQKNTGSVKLMKNILLIIYLITTLGLALALIVVIALPKTAPYS